MNEVLQAAQGDRPGPGGARYRYGTQVGVGPPTFALFGGRPPPANYERFLEKYAVTIEMPREEGKPAAAAPAGGGSR